MSSHLPLLLQLLLFVAPPPSHCSAHGPSAMPTALPCPSAAPTALPFPWSPLPFHEWCLYSVPPNSPFPRRPAQCLGSFRSPSGAGGPLWDWTKRPLQGSSCGHGGQKPGMPLGGKFWKAFWWPGCENLPWAEPVATGSGRLRPQRCPHTQQGLRAISSQVSGTLGCSFMERCAREEMGSLDITTQLLKQASGGPQGGASPGLRALSYTLDPFSLTQSLGTLMPRGNWGPKPMTPCKNKQFGPAGSGLAPHVRGSSELPPARGPRAPLGSDRARDPGASGFGLRGARLPVRPDAAR